MKKKIPKKVKKLDTLKDTIPTIKKLGAEVGMEITEEEIAAKMNMSREQFEGYLNAADKTPNEVLGQLWAAYDDVVKAVQRSNNSGPLRMIIKSLKDRGKAKGMHILDEEIIEKIAIPPEQFEAYLNGEVPTPDDLFSFFRAAWPDLLKDVRIIVHRVSVNMEELDEDLG